MKGIRRTLCAALTLILLCSTLMLANADSYYYQLGDTMEDFTATLSDGTQVSLSQLLKSKQAVLINFWASWCTPCQMEFPAMQEAYLEYADQVAVVALSIETSDTSSVIAAYQQENSLESLPMGRDTEGIANRFGFTGIPTSVLIDRYGVICWQDTGAIFYSEAFEKLFAAFTGDDYAESKLDNKIYTIYFVDENRNPIEGVTAQICDDTTCEVVTSDTNGAAFCVKSAYPYSLKVLSIPEGYTFDSTQEITLPKTGGATLVKLQN